MVLNALSKSRISNGLSLWIQAGRQFNIICSPKGIPEPVISLCLISSWWREEWIKSLGTPSLISELRQSSINSSTSICLLGAQPSRPAAKISSFWSASSPVRGLFGGGYTPTVLNTIQYVTIASTGNTINFGEVTQVSRFTGATSDSRRAVFCGRYTPSGSNTIDYVQIVTEGNAVDFGDTTSNTQASATSSGHGGL